MIDGGDPPRLIDDAHKKAANGAFAYINGHSERASDTPSFTQPRKVRPPSVIIVFLAAIVLLTAGYTTVFSLTVDRSWGDSFGTALANVLPLAAIAAATYVILKHVVLRQGVMAQADRKSVV